MREFCLLTSLRCLNGLARRAVDPRITLRRVDLPFAALPLMARKCRRDPPDRLQAQRACQLLHLQSVEPFNAETVARTLHRFVGTRHGHLRQHGAAVQSPRSQVRRARALELPRRRAAIKQVVRKLGFRSQRASRAPYTPYTHRPASPIRVTSPCTHVPKMQCFGQNARRACQ